MECELNLGGDGEPIDGYSCVRKVFAEPSDCLECGRAIAPGTVREIVTGDYEGEPIEWHTCLDCANIATAFQTEGRIVGTLWDELEDSGGPEGDPGFDHFNSACLARVETASAKSYLQERFRKWKGLG